MASSSNKQPSTKDMVIEAITFFKERKGSSLQAIKKYIESQYHLQMSEQVKKRVCKTIHELVADGTLERTKGIGANGSFRLGADYQAAKKKEEKAAEKKAAEKAAPKKAAPKKAAPKKASPKKTAPAAKRKPLKQVNK